MSFSFTIPVPSIAEFDTSAAEAVTKFEALLAQSDNQSSAESMESVNAAIEAARGIINSGVVGTGSVYVVVSGHANPGHQPAPAPTATDTVSISVTSTAPLPDAAAAPTA